MNWIEITEENKPKDEVVLGFNTKWIDEDFNPDGVRLCHWCDLSGWVSSYWSNYHECYYTRNSVVDDELYKLPNKEDQIPTHFCKIVKPVARL